MNIKNSEYGFDDKKRLVNSYIHNDFQQNKLTESDKEKLRIILADSLVEVQQAVSSLMVANNFLLHPCELNPDNNGNLKPSLDKLTLFELKDFLEKTNKSIDARYEANSELLATVQKLQIEEESILSDNNQSKSSIESNSKLLLTGKKKPSHTIVEQQDWTNLDLGITNGSANVLWISQQIAVMLIQSNSESAKIAADAADLLNRVLSELAAVSQFLTTLSSIYTEALNVKQAQEIKDKDNSGITSSTISFNDLIDNNTSSARGDETPELTFATYTDADGNIRQGFLMTDVPDEMSSLMGLSGGSFEYLKWNGYYIQNMDGDFVKDGAIVNESVKKVTEKEGYIFVDSVTIDNLMSYTSQLLALAVPSSSNNPKGDFYNSYGNAYENNITIQGAIDGLANSVKQVQNLLSGISQQVSIYQGNAQSATTPFNTILSMINQILNMLGV